MRIILPFYPTQAPMNADQYRHGLDRRDKASRRLNMTDKSPHRSRFRKAREDAAFAKPSTHTPQTESEAYKLAFQDTQFLLREDLRPVRFQLELLKPELLLDEAKIESMLVVYGSARIPEPAAAQAKIDAATTDAERRTAECLAANAKYYDEARKLAQIASTVPEDSDGKRHFVVCSGGGPSIMEAANRGATDMGRESVGLNIVLPHEQAPNAYVTPSLSFQFHYFALRKMHFLLRARAVAVFPGGFGTFDETFELLTLVQTGKIKPMPILLFGERFWRRVVNFEALVEEGVISADDLNLFHFVESAEEAWTKICEFYALEPDGTPR
jgi:uncharacterized protein (TIGR00730 family)